MFFSHLSFLLFCVPKQRASILLHFFCLKPAIEIISTFFTILLEMKKRTFWWLSAGLAVLIVASVLWVFAEPIQHFFTYEISSVGTKKLEGVKRRTSYQGRLREAQTLIDHEYFSLATIELSTAIQEQPDGIDPYLLLGEIYIRTRDTNKLGNLIAQLKKDFPDSPDVPVLEGRKLIAEESFAEALEFFEQEGAALVPELKFYHGILLSLQNDHNGAMAIFASLQGLPTSSEKAEAVYHAYNEFEGLNEGKNPHLFGLIGKVLAEHNENILAHKFAEIAIKEDIDYVDAWIVRGFANLQLGENEVALQDLRHAYELDPIRPQTHYFLALALHKVGEDEEAILFFEKSLEHDFEFSDEVRWKLVELFTAQKNYDRVIGLYTDLLDTDSEPQKFVSAIHTAVNILQKPELALDFAERLIQADPESSFALNMYGWALVVNKKFVQAEKVLNKAERIDPENPRTFLNLGLLHEEQAKFSEAKELYKKSYDLGKDLEGEAATAVTNLAAGKYNELLARTEKPEEQEAPVNPKNSP
jgi:tetratricopeptide (TPR) repeat protein